MPPTDTHPLILAAFLLAALPALLTLVNHALFRSPRPVPRDRPKPSISALIPARNEAHQIRHLLEDLLASHGVTLEVIVLDDHSEDDTQSVVRSVAQNDPRLRLEQAPSLPPGWCGKQHACAHLATLARHHRLLFIDADVRLTPDALARLSQAFDQRQLDLLSAFPRQVTGSFLEKLLIPLIEYLLLGYLPLFMARRFHSPGFAAGCGQVFLTRSAAYARAGGHTAIASSMHDGVALPRAFRRAGLRTDICAGHQLFQCRMYRGSAQVWAGLLKNAHEAIASPPLILPFSLLLAGGSILPVLLVILTFLGWSNLSAASAGVILTVAYLPRALNALRFRQSLLGLVLHPLSVLLFLVLQWQALFRWQRGLRPQWKGRSVA